MESPSIPVTINPPSGVVETLKYMEQQTGKKIAKDLKSITFYLGFRKDHMVNNADILPQRELTPYEQAVADIMEKNIDISKCQNEDERRQRMNIRRAYEARKRYFDDIPIEVRNEIKCAFLALAKKKNDYIATLRDLLTWLDYYGPDVDKNKTDNNIKITCLANPKFNFVEGEDYMIRKMKGNKQEILIMRSAIKELCMILDTKYSRGVIEYYAQLQWDYVVLLKAHEVEFQKAVGALKKQMDEYQRRTDTIVAKLDSYNEELKKYEKNYKELQRCRAELLVYQEINSDLKSRITTRERNKGSGDWEAFLASSRFRQMQIMTKNLGWKVFRFCYAPLRPIRRLEDMDDSETNEIWYYLPFDLPNGKPPSEYKEVFDHNISKDCIRYHDISDIAALKKYVENPENFIEKDKNRPNVYKLELYKLRGFFFRRFVLRRQNKLKD